MKNRKKVVMSFLMIAVLLMGVGYAALTDTLVINGTADISEAGAQNAFNQDIKFTAAVAHDNKDLASVVQGDDDMASFTANSLNGKGDTAEFTFTIANEGDLDAVVTPSLSGNDKEEYFDIYSDWDGQAQELASGDTITYTVTVELLKTPTATIHGSFHIQLTAVTDEVTTTVAETTTAEPADTTEPVAP